MSFAFSRRRGIYNERHRLPQLCAAGVTSERPRAGQRRRRTGRALEIYKPNSRMEASQEAERSLRNMRTFRALCQRATARLQRRLRRDCLLQAANCSGLCSGSYLGRGRLAWPGPAAPCTCTSMLVRGALCELHMTRRSCRLRQRLVVLVEAPSCLLEPTVGVLPFGGQG